MASSSLSNILRTSRLMTFRTRGRTMQPSASIPLAYSTTPPTPTPAASSLSHNHIHITTLISSPSTINPLTQLYLHWLHHSKTLPFPLPPTLHPSTKSIAGLKLYTLLSNSEVVNYLNVLKEIEGVECWVKELEEQEGGEDLRGMESTAEGKELVVVFGWDSWELARRFIERALELFEVHDHHCKIILQPQPSASPSHTSKFLITIETHTHTPRSPKPSSLPSSSPTTTSTQSSPSPGLTRKDFLLAWDLGRVGCEIREEKRELEELEEDGKGAGKDTEDGQ